MKPKNGFFILDSKEKLTDFLECITPTQDILDVKQRKKQTGQIDSYKIAAMFSVHQTVLLVLSCIFILFFLPINRPVTQLQMKEGKKSTAQQISLNVHFPALHFCFVLLCTSLVTIICLSWLIDLFL